MAVIPKTTLFFDAIKRCMKELFDYENINLFVILPHTLYD